MSLRNLTENRWERRKCVKINRKTEDSESQWDMVSPQWQRRIKTNHVESPLTWLSWSHFNWSCYFYLFNVSPSLSLFFVFHPAGTSGDSCSAQWPLDVTMMYQLLKSLGYVGDHDKTRPQISKQKKDIFNIKSLYAFSFIQWCQWYNVINDPNQPKASVGLFSYVHFMPPHLLSPSATVHHLGGCFDS